MDYEAFRVDSHWLWDHGSKFARKWHHHAMECRARSDLSLNDWLWDHGSKFARKWHHHATECRARSDLSVNVCLTLLPFHIKTWSCVDCSSQMCFLAVEFETVWGWSLRYNIYIRLYIYYIRVQFSVTHCSLASLAEQSVVGQQTVNSKGEQSTVTRREWSSQQWILLCSTWCSFDQFHSHILVWQLLIVSLNLCYVIYLII